MIATPLLFIAGAGAALFWTLGVTGIDKGIDSFELAKCQSRGLYPP